MKTSRLAALAAASIATCAFVSGAAQAQDATADPLTPVGVMTAFPTVVQTDTGRVHDCPGERRLRAGLHDGWEGSHHADGSQRIGSRGLCLGGTGNKYARSEKSRRKGSQSAGFHGWCG